LWLHVCTDDYTIENSGELMSSREQFEAWRKSLGDKPTKLMRAGDGYLWAITQEKWVTWQASRDVPIEIDPVAWRVFDGEGGYDLMHYEYNETYRDDFIAENPKLAKDWVAPLYDKAALIAQGYRVKE
jgi:hypothetical protein